MKTTNTFECDPAELAGIIAAVFDGVAMVLKEIGRIEEVRDIRREAISIRAEERQAAREAAQKAKLVEHHLAA